jgi:hypothetical protein
LLVGFVSFAWQTAHALTDKTPPRRDRRIRQKGDGTVKRGKTEHARARELDALADSEPLWTSLGRALRLRYPWAYLQILQTLELFAELANAAQQRRTIGHRRSRQR